MNIEIVSKPKSEFMVIHSEPSGVWVANLGFRVGKSGVAVSSSRVEDGYMNRGFGKRLHSMMGEAVGPGIVVRSDHVVNYETKQQLSRLGIAERFIEGCKNEQFIDDINTLGQLLIARVYLGTGFDNLVFRMKKEEVREEYIFYPDDFKPDPWIFRYKLSLTATTTDVHSIPELDNLRGASRVFRYINMYPNGK